jgi:hypothetical protein
MRNSRAHACEGRFVLSKLWKKMQYSYVWVYTFIVNLNSKLWLCSLFRISDFHGVQRIKFLELLADSVFFIEKRSSHSQFKLSSLSMSVLCSGLYGRPINSVGTYIYIIDHWFIWNLLANFCYCWSVIVDLTVCPISVRDAELLLQAFSSLCS